MIFHPEFDKHASHWCKRCGAPDSLMASRERRISESASIDLPWTKDHDTIIEQSYHCSFCHVESEDLDDLLTESQYEACVAFCNRKKISPTIPGLVSEDEDTEE